MQNMSALPQHDAFPHPANANDEFAAVVEALHHASGFELYRLQAAINRLLDQPKWMNNIRQWVRPGQHVDYFSIHSDTVQQGKVMELRRKHVVVYNEAEGKSWLIPYAAINLDGRDVHSYEAMPTSSGVHTLQIGEKVAFVDKYHQERSGLIIRLNTKTATLVCDGQQWRIAYSLLNRIVEN